MRVRSLVLSLLLLSISLLPALLGCASPPRKSVFSGDEDLAKAGPAEHGRESTATPDPDPVEHARIVQAAEQYLGTPYRYGGSSSKGMDCSGLVQTVFAQEGLSLPRSCAAQARQGTPVTRSELRQGDLVFFGKSSAPPSHVGIYVGNGRFIHASTSKGKVRRDALTTTWFRQHYIGARRILPGANTLSSNTH